MRSISSLAGKATKQDGPSLSTVSMDEEVFDPKEQRRFERNISRNAIDLQILENSSASDEEDLSAKNYIDMVENGWDRQQIFA